MNGPNRNNAVDTVEANVLIEDSIFQFDCLYYDSIAVNIAVNQ